MANIVYNIVVDEVQGTADVTQDVTEIMTADSVTFVCNNKDTAIRFPTGSPFVDAGSPQAGQIFPIGKGKKGPFAIGKNLDTGELRTVAGFGMRRTFHFDCGVKDPNTGQFVGWGKSGGGTAGEDLPTGGR